MNLYLNNIFISEDISFFKLISILLVSFFSNIFSSISGGGAGLIQLPALLLFGIPYYKALSLHKIATVALGIGGSIRRYSLLKDRIPLLAQLLLFGIPGVLIGTKIVAFTSEEYLYFILGLLSITLGVYSSYKPNLGLIKINKEVTFYSKLKFNIIIFLIGILNGSISSGTGLLVTIILIRTYGMDFLSAVALTFISVGIFWNAVGAISLLGLGEIPLDLLWILLIGSFFGGLVGAHLSILKGNKLIKKLFTVLCFLVGISLVIKSINSTI